MKARLSLSAGALLALTVPATAEQKIGDPAAGHELASRLCTACHIVGDEAVGSDIAPPFPALARDPDMTLTKLHGWLGPGHPVLRQLALTPQQIADINAYLDTLHEAPAEDGVPRVETEEPPPAIERAPPEELGQPIPPRE